jgi:hypothetical protein
MADIKKLSEQIVELGERLGNVADAAQGKEPGSKAPRARWLLLPAAGAGLYALTTSGAFTRQAKDVVKEVKDRATDLPDELVARVHDATRTSSPSNGRKSTRSRSGTRRRKTTTSSSR